jgi:hypothetical protein
MNAMTVKVDQQDCPPSRFLHDDAPHISTQASSLAMHQSEQNLHAQRTCMELLLEKRDKPQLRNDRTSSRLALTSQMCKYDFTNRICRTETIGRSRLETGTTASN